MVSALSAIFGLAFAASTVALTGDLGLHDPSMCKRDDGTYFLFSTGAGIETRTSTNREDWQFVGRVFPDGASWTDAYTGTSNGGIWAPDCNIIDGVFYLYYSASTMGSMHSAIFLATSPTGEPGSWTDKGLVTSTAKGDDHNAIDPNLIIDGDSWYLSFGSYWTGIKGAPVDPKTGNITTTSYNALAKRNGTATAIEGSVIWKEGDYYYLFTSWDACCEDLKSTYNIRVGRSKTVDGGYVDKNGVPLSSGGGTLVLGAQGSIIGPGGQELISDDDGTILIYHYYSKSGHSIGNLGLARLDFSSGWPVVVS